MKKQKALITLLIIIPFIYLLTGCPQPPDIDPPKPPDPVVIDPIPQNFQVKDSDSRYITFSWSAVPTAEEYIIERAETLEEADFALNRKRVDAKAGTVYKDNTVVTSITYNYRIRSVINGQESDPSPVITATTSGVGKPQNFSVANYNNMKIELTWKEVPGAVSYELFFSESVNTNYGSTPIDQTPDITGIESDNAIIRHNFLYEDGISYYYKIRAVNAAGEYSSFTAEKSIMVDVGVPLNFLVNDSGKSFIAMQWDAVDGASHYKIYRSSNRDSGYTPIATPTRTDYSNSGLSSAKKYYYKVSAVINGVESGLTLPIEGVTRPPTPLKSSIGFKNPTENEFTVTWGEVSVNVLGYWINVVNIDQLGGGINLDKWDYIVPASSAQQVTVNSLDPATTYRIYVRSYILNDSNEYVLSDIEADPQTAFTNLPPVTNFLTGTTTKSSIVLNWDAVPGATGYNIVRSTDPSFLMGNHPINIDNGTATSYTDNTALSPFTKYYYKIVGKKTELYGGKTATSTVTPAIEKYTSMEEPTNVTAIDWTDSTITLQWNKVIGGERYEIYRANTSTGSSTKVGDVPDDGTPANTTLSFLNNTGLTDYQDYFYTVKAFNDTNTVESDPSLKKEAYTRITPPQNLRADFSRVYKDKIYVEWDRQYDGTDIEIWRSKDNNTSYSLLKTVAKSDTWEYDSGLLASTLYFYKVKVINSTNRDQDSTFSNEISVMTKMSEPTGLNATSITSNSCTLNWNTLTGADYYELKVNGITKATNITTTTYNLNGLTVGAKNQIELIAHRTSPAVTSDPATINVYTCPTDPTNLTIGINSADKSHLDLNWTASSGTGVQYELINVTTPSTTNQTGTTKTVTGLNGLTNYTFNVRAFITKDAADGGGKVYSLNDTGPQTKKTGLGTPTVTLTAQSRSIKVSWTSINGATSYKVERSSNGGSTYSTITITNGAPDDGANDYTIDYKYKVTAIGGGKESLPGQANKTPNP